MKKILVTTRSNHFGGCLATAYCKAGGTHFDTIIVVPERDDLKWPVWIKPIVAFKLLGLCGSINQLRYSRLQWTLRKAVVDLGFSCDWIKTLSSPETSVHHVNNINSDTSLDIIQAKKPDLLVSIGVPQIISPIVLDIPKVASLNLHNGDIPKYRGHFGTFWEVQQGEEYGVVSLHHMVPAVDKGQLVGKEKIRLAECKSFLDLMLKKKIAGGKLLANALKQVEKTGTFLEDTAVEKTPQNISSTKESYFGWPELKDILQFHWPS